MGDIDFDELDKAVNSLMGNKTTGSDAQTAGQAAPEEKPLKTLNINDTAAATPKQIEEAAKKITGGQPEASTVKSISLDNTPAPTASPRQSTGRFMDVMHPSADMRSSSNIPKPPAREASPPQPVSPPPTPAKPQTASPSGTPGDTASFSPFLPNAKVEKRPLGTTPPIGAIPSPFGKPSEEKKIETEQQNQPVQSPADAHPPQPEAELEKDEEPVETVSINSDEKPNDDSAHDNQRSINASDFGALSPEEKQLQQLESNEVKASAPATDESVRSVESGDTEKFKDGHPWEKGKHDESNGIYDVDSLKHPVKQKSGWMIVVAIIVVILLCVGLAAAAFFTISSGA